MSSSDEGTAVAANSTRKVKKKKHKHKKSKHKKHKKKHETKRRSGKESKKKSRRKARKNANQEHAHSTKAPAEFSEQTQQRFLEAIRSGDCNKVSMYMEIGGIDINRADVHGHTPLHVAATFPDDEKAASRITLLLLRAKSDVDARDREGDTALHLAVRAQAAELSLLLVRNGAQGDVENKKGVTADTLGLHNMQLRAERLHAMNVRECYEQEQMRQLHQQRIEEEQKWKQKLYEEVMNDEENARLRWEREWREAPAAHTRRVKEQTHQRAPPKRKAPSGPDPSEAPPKRKPKGWEEGETTDTPPPPLEDTAGLRTQAATSAPALATMREEHESAWSSFIESAPILTSISQIPWPTGPEGNRFALPPPANISAADMKKTLRTLQLRWHPDKFQLKWRSKWRDTEGSEEKWDTVMTKVREVSQAVNAIKEQWTSFNNTA